MSDIKSEEYDIFVKQKGADDSTYLGVGCVEDMSNILKRGSRNVTTRRCVDKGSVEKKQMTTIKHADGTIKYAFNLSDTSGKKMLNDAFDDENVDVELTIKIVLDDIGTTHSTYIERDVLVKEISIEPDVIWKETASLEFIGKPMFTAAD